MKIKHVFAALVVAFLSCWRGLAADGPVVRLPEVVVSEEMHRQTEHWRYVRQGNFEIISQTKDSTIQKLAKNLELVPLIVKTIWPAPNVVEEKPTEIILCDSEKTFEKFVPLQVKRAVDATLVDRLFLYDESREVIILKCDRIDDDDRFKEILRDYARRCLLSLKQPPPDWFVTGMAEVISDADYSVAGRKLKIHYAQLDQVTIRSGGVLSGTALYDTEKPTPAVREIIRGAFDNRTAYDAVSDDTMSTANNTHQRFNNYFAKNHYHPGLDDVLQNSATLNPDDYRMTCWAFIHLCAFAQKRGYMRPLRALLLLVGKEPDGDMIAMFRKAFGQSPRALNTTVSDYATTAMSHGVTKEIDYNEPPPVVVSDAKLEQFTRLKADAYQLGGYPSEAAAEVKRFNH